MFKRAPKNYADRVRAIRGKLTQTQFAELVGVSYVTVNRWENQRNVPSRLAWRRLLKLNKVKRRQKT